MKKTTTITTAERLTRLETKIDLLMNNHLSHVEKRLTRLEAGMIGLLVFAVTNLLVVVYNLI
jgi:tetrahydromethanopterin S-methyltransferase subunit G